MMVTLTIWSLRVLLRDSNGIRTDADVSCIVSILITNGFVEVNYGFFDDATRIQLSPFYTIGVVAANTVVEGDILTSSNLSMSFTTVIYKYGCLR